MIHDPAVTAVRAFPKVPGLNAQPLAPSIGTGTARLSKGAKLVIPGVSQAGVTGGFVRDSDIQRSAPVSKSARKRALREARKRGLISW